MECGSLTPELEASVGTGKTEGGVLQGDPQGGTDGQQQSHPQCRGHGQQQNAQCERRSHHESLSVARRRKVSLYWLLASATILASTGSSSAAMASSFALP